MQEVIEKIIRRIETAIRRSDNANFTNGLLSAKDIIKQEAAEYNNGWIPCSERLPDDFMSFEYLTIRKGHTLATITYYCVVNNKWYLSRNSSKEIEVVAWQPLPEPYHPKFIQECANPVSQEEREELNKNIRTIPIGTYQTNADRIRSMSDEELAEFLCKVKSDYQWADHEFPSEEECGEWEKWLQSEVEE